MKVKVVKTFAAYNCLFKQGEVDEMSRESFEKLNSTRLGILLEEVGGDSKPDLDAMTKKELAKYASQKGIKLDPRLTKKAMIEELS